MKRNRKNWTWKIRECRFEKSSASNLTRFVTPTKWQNVSQQLLLLFSSPDQLSVLTLFRYPFHLHVAAVARKRSQSFCQKCRWQVTAKHAYTVRMWLCMKWLDMLHGSMVYTECAETAAVSRGTSQVAPKQGCKYFGGYSKRAVTHSESHATKAQLLRWRTENSAI